MEEGFNNKGTAMEKEYYYADNGQQFGPFSFSELKNKNIKKETLVWCTGMDNWKPAGSLSELAELFLRQVPPPLTVSSERVIENKTEVIKPVPPAINRTEANDRNPENEPHYTALARLNKIFAIIGLISGGIMHLISYPVMFGRDRYYNYYSDYWGHGMDEEWGILFFFLSLYFIAFSIIVMIKTSRYLKNK